MAHGGPICASCGAIDGVEEHHLYLRADGCPDDLTVWLCNVCHGRAHGMRRRVNISEAIKQGQARKKAATGKCGGRKSYIERDPEMVALAKKLARYPVNGRKRSLREVAAELAAAGHTAAGGKPFAATAVARMIA